MSKINSEDQKIEALIKKREQENNAFKKLLEQLEKKRIKNSIKEK